MNLGDLNKVWEIKSLKKPGEEEAKKILERVAKQVQPILRKHKWRVKLLSEFCPNNPSLLGLNVGGGIHVKLRLRRPNRDWDFFPYDQILDTMLHELCHNAHGPHNASFYKLWDELRKECEELMAKGITGTGEGFDLPGRRLGGFSRQPPLSSLRITALAAAENRARLGSLLPSGPKRLGGDSSIMGALSPIQAAAMAAERRLQDDIWCGSQSFEDSENDETNSHFSEELLHLEKILGSSRLYTGSSSSDMVTISQERNDTSKSSLSFQSCDSHLKSGIMDLSLDPSTSGSTVDCARSRKRSKLCNTFPEPHSHQESSFVDLTGASIPGSSLDHGATSKAEEFALWQCGTCTLLNPPLAPICKLCSTRKPPDGGATCTVWSCKFCTLENSVKLDKCSACDQWRYSLGPPVSTRAPNVGT